MTDAVSIIETKRDGGRLADEQISWFMAGLLDGRVSDEQAAALLMAIFLRGMVDDELAVWTKAMIDSGERLDLSTVGRRTVDKHSTGGVGDKVSLVLCPLVAACGAAVPQLSGRGLGHTGGTLDKMETIAGWQAMVSPAAMIAQLRDVGAVVCGAGESLAPADRKLYALRDVTGTVPSIPLIASSIMSKKIAEGTEALVLDVKVGSGAFMRDVAMARELAETMVRLGAAHDVATTAFLTAMDAPLGRTVGNALEVAESIETLDGNGPSDLVEITVALAREMLTLARIDGDPAAMLTTGRAKSTWDAMVRAQGGDPAALLPTSSHRVTIASPATGYLARLDALAVGLCSWRLGAGRARQGDAVSATAGVVCLVKPGAAVEAGQPLLELHVDDARRLDDARAALDDAFDVGAVEVEPSKLVIDVIRP